MGTSTPFGGPKNDRPLVPTFIDDTGRGDADGNDDSTDAQDGNGGDGTENPVDGDSQGAGSTPQPAPPLPPPGPAGRFTAPRTNFTSFAQSGPHLI